ncbi:MAG: transglutaminase family protein [Desulfuromonadales bacterium]|nr:transglutaminase family protein [Desulfuromonadales bacterium]
MRYRVTHITEFVYESLVGHCYNEARLLPCRHPQQKVLSAELKIDPVPDDHYQRIDYFGNRTNFFSIFKPHEKLQVTAISDVQVTVPRQLDMIESLPWETVRDQLQNVRSGELVEVSQFCLSSPSIPLDELLAGYARSSFSAGRPLLDAVHDLMRRIFNEFSYDPDFSTISTPLKEVLEHRSGVCQDFAHLAIGCLRSQGLAARYVSGYIETLPPPGQERLVGADASHAWFSVYQPGTGWVDFDPTNNQMPQEQHITVARGRDYSDVTPLKGVAYGGGEHELKVSVDVLRLDGANEDRQLPDS